MDAFFFNPLIQASGASQISRRVEIGGQSENFASYMSRKLADQREGTDLLGVRDRAFTESTAKDKGSIGRGEKNEETDLAGLLSGFMQELKGLSEDGEAKPGEWSFFLSDSGLLRKLGESAGMEVQDLAGLTARLSGEGDLPLPDFFAAMARHFEKQARPAQVIAPETDLPMLAVLLSRMALPQEQINRISKEAVVADGSLDLEIFLAGLESVKEAGEPTTLTSLEAEQLWNMLASAGVARHHLERLFPGNEISPGQQVFDRSVIEIKLSREQLQSILRQAIAAVESDRPQVDLPEFFTSLDRILAQAGFSDKRVGWSPAVMQTMEAMYRELLESVELARVQIEQVRKGSETKEQEIILADAHEEEQGFFGLAGEDQEATAARQAAQSDVGQGAGKPEQGAGRSMARKSSVGRGSIEFAGYEPRAGGAPAEPESPRAISVGPRIAPEVQQQIFNQLSTGVLKGLSANEHHLTLKLFPRELGEVRIEMLVRDQQVSLAITMENSRVKEVLESNLGQFRENLERQGFTLGECMVSVDQRDKSGDSWQRFLMAWKNKQQDAARHRDGNSRPAGEIMTAIMSRPAREGINVVV